jgi:hypothetical protein
MDIQGFSWRTQGKPVEKLKKKEDHSGWEWWAGISSKVLAKDR